jgi:hypothetical protein
MPLLGQNNAYHQRHESLSVKAPPRSGPATLETLKTAPIMPINAATLCFGTEKAMIVNAPDPRPAAPTPEIARPMIKVVLLGETAQIRLPASKRKIEKTKVGLSAKNLYAFPQVD